MAEEYTTLELLRRLWAIIKPKRDELQGLYVKQELPKTIGNKIRGDKNVDI